VFELYNTFESIYMETDHKLKLEIGSISPYELMEVRVGMRVTLQMTVSQSVSLGIELPGLMTTF
jgi:hypothetical protein